MDKKAKPSDADAHVERGNTLFKMGLVREAQKQWKQALELDPDHLSAHYHLGQSYQEQGDDRAEQEFREILRIDPNASAAHLALAEIFDEREDLPNAIAEYREILRISPDDDKTRLDLAWDLIEAGNLEEAEIELEGLTDEALDESEWWVAIGDAYAKKGETAEAIQAYQDALEINPDRADARAALKQLAPAELQNAPWTTVRSYLIKGLFGAGTLASVVGAALLIGSWSTILPSLEKIPASLQQRRIVLRADRALTTDELNASIKIFEERLGSIGAMPKALYTNAPDTVVVRVAADILVPLEVWESAPEGQSLEFVDLGDAPLAEGTLITTTGPDTVVAPGTLIPAFSATTITGARVYRTVMTGQDLSRASVQFGSNTGQPMIAFTLTNRGHAIFADYTKRNLGKYLAIAVDKKVISAPVIKSAIDDYNGVIEGQFTLQEAQRLVLQLNARPLPAQFQVVSDGPVPFFWVEAPFR